MRYYCLSLILVLMAAVSCSDRETEPLSVDVKVNIELPDDIDKTAVEDATVTFHNIGTGLSRTFDADKADEINVSLLPGLYNIVYKASTVLPGGADGVLKGMANGVEIYSKTAGIHVATFLQATDDDLIISELFFTGTLQSSGDQYNGDQYIKLYNNTDRLIYADGLTIFESAFLTTQKFDYTPDIMAEAVSVDALYTIPGNGHEYPVAPREELLIADIAIDHRAVNPNSFDLSHADFEWYDQSTNPQYVDIDNPTVPNLDKWYCYTLTVWLLHNRGFKAYGLARIPVAKDEYLSDYRYTCYYDQVTQAGTFPMSKTICRIPNEWICDLVTTSVAAEYKWNVSAPSLDMGWSHCGTIDGDKKRYFHAIRRVAEDVSADGKTVLRNTNNSSIDFNAYVYPSEIERQHTAIDRDGTLCGTETIDGVKSLLK